MRVKFDKIIFIYQKVVTFPLQYVIISIIKLKSRRIEMKKYAKLFSLVALTLAITLIFSGCGLIDFAASVLKKDNTNSTTNNVIDTVPTGDVVYDNTTPTDSAIIAPPSEVTEATQGTTQTTASSNSATEANKNTNQTTQKPTKLPATTAPAVTEEGITEEELSEMPVKDIMDLLFATEDPNTASKILTTCGFEYDEKQGIFYSQINPWQRMFGFNYIYDMAAPMAGMNYDTERIYFEYDNKDWMIQIWKGQYGITAGGEIGLYNKTDKIMHYDCADDDELIEMAFNFYNHDEFVFSRGPEKHWWLTGFKVFHSGISMAIDMDITLKFPNIEMANAFDRGLKKVVRNTFTDPMTYTRTSLTFKIHW